MNEPTIVTVTGCRDCPFMSDEWYADEVVQSCKHPEQTAPFQYFSRPQWDTCPLKQQPIIIKLEEE